MIRTRSILLLLLMLLSGLAHSYAFLYTFIDPSDPYHKIYWHANEITMNISDLKTPPASVNQTLDYYSAMIEAIDEWNGKANINVLYDDGEASSSQTLSVTFGSTAFFMQRSALAITNSGFIGNAFVSAPITFNPDVSWGVDGSNSNSTIDFRRTAMHEMGHVIGLGHPDGTSPTQSVIALMNSRYDVQITRTQIDDSNGIQALYGSTTATISNGVDNATLSFTSSGDASWFGSTGRNGELSPPADGDAIFSGKIINGQKSCITTTVASSGILSFDWNISSESSGDFLRFYINDRLQDDRSGEPSWSSFPFKTITSNSKLKWCYEKNGSISRGSDAGALSAIAYSLYLPAPFSVSASSGTSAMNIQLTWSRVSGSSNYRLHRSKSPNGPYSLIQTTTFTSYRDTEVTPGVAHYYRIRSCHQPFVAQCFLAPESATAAGYRVVIPPINVTASMGANVQHIALTWEEFRPYKDYRIYRSTSSNVSYTRIQTLAAEPAVGTCIHAGCPNPLVSRSYFDTSAILGELYYYRIQGCPPNPDNGEVFCSDDSAQVSGSRISNLKLYIKLFLEGALQ